MTLPISPAHGKLLAALRLHPDDPRFVLIGAAALGHHIVLPRATADVDLAFVAEHAELEFFLTTAGWRRDPKLPQRWLDVDGNKADVLPATSRLIEAGSISFEHGIEMSLAGFDLALAHTERVPVPGHPVEVEVACLPVLVVLKIVAWLDRPHERTKDLGDLGRVLAFALDDLDARRWEAPLAGEKFDEQSSVFVGNEVRAIAHARHLERIHEFLRRLSDESRPWAGMMARLAGYGGDDPEGKTLRNLLAFERALHS